MRVSVLLAWGFIYIFFERRRGQAEACATRAARLPPAAGRREDNLLVVKSEIEVESKPAPLKPKGAAPDDSIEIIFVREECVAPLALEEFLFVFPALTGWANFCRAHGAGD